jgi:Xaa-Pro aminopeptidase
VQAVVVSNPVNVAYVTGFEGVFDSEDAHAAVVTGESLTLYTDSRYRDAAGIAATETEWDVRVPREDLYGAVCSDLGQRGVVSIALEASVPYQRFRSVTEKFEGDVEAADGWVETIRRIKDAEEIGRIRAAQALTDRAFDHILGIIAPGITEAQIALELEFFMRREGSQGVAFDSIVASGPNSALPHARVTERVVQPGDFLKLDFGARVDGYCADMTRTLVVGAASETQKNIYSAVLAANAAGISACKGGTSAAWVDKAARDVIVARGFGELFGHGLGHGVGLEVHEKPSVNGRSSEPLPPGAVVTIEPGVYVPGFGGVRIEDLVVVSESGCEVLTRSAKDLIEL